MPPQVVVIVTLDVLAVPPQVVVIVLAVPPPDPFSLSPEPLAAPDDPVEQASTSVQPLVDSAEDVASVLGNSAWPRSHTSLKQPLEDRTSPQASSEEHGAGSFGDIGGLVGHWRKNAHKMQAPPRRRQNPAYGPPGDVPGADLLGEWAAAHPMIGPSVAMRISARRASATSTWP
ncbi:hypothetical protein [Nannocystis bainbridge]|uniref:Uncharacterized protein n=1 Tax=Nannocystis bainbridge TaxID=2995303 RepID=A0ABT5DYC9_9BACT|nr:hypothetical protein [Nannocystis bainbridge]MDC0717753.1 hypothetical protein [Nannocystis bainbridge]